MLLKDQKTTVEVEKKERQRERSRESSSKRYTRNLSNRNQRGGLDRSRGK